MSLKDISRNGKLIPGSFAGTRNDIPIIGQQKKPVAFWQQVGLVAVRPPTQKDDGSVDNPSYIAIIGGVRTDGLSVTTAVEISPETVALGVQGIIEQIGMGLNMLHTYRECSCPRGKLCPVHTPPKTDAKPDDPPSQVDDMRQTLITEN